MAVAPKPVPFRSRHHPKTLPPKNKKQKELAPIWSMCTCRRKRPRLKDPGTQASLEGIGLDGFVAAVMDG